MELNNVEQEKNNICVFSENNGFYIDLSTLNFLNNIDSNKLDFEKNIYGPLTHKEFSMLKADYNVDVIYKEDKYNDINKITGRQK